MAEISEQEVRDYINGAIAIMEDGLDSAEKSKEAKEAFDAYIDSIRAVNNSGIWTGYVEEFLDDDSFADAEESFAESLKSPSALWEQIEMMLRANGKETEEDRLDYVLDGLESWVGSKVDLLKDMLKAI